MKRLMFILSMLSLSLISFAQSSSFGVQIGFVEPILRESTPLSGSNKLTDKTILNGAKIGLVYDATIIKGFGVSLGLNYAISGNHTNWETMGSLVYPKQKSKNMMQTIEIPIDWQYKFQIAKQTYLILYTGPTVKYNFQFRTKSDIQEMVGSQIKESSEKYNHYDIDADKDAKKDYTPINISWGLGGGFQYKNYYLRAGYDFGIYFPYKDAYYTSNPGQNTQEDIRRHGRFDEWSIRIGIYFLNW